jgi:hypothetical protein
MMLTATEFDEFFRARNIIADDRDDDVAMSFVEMLTMTDDMAWRTDIDEHPHVERKPIDIDAVYFSAYYTYEFGMATTDYCDGLPTHCEFHPQGGHEDPAWVFYGGAQCHFTRRVYAGNGAHFFESIFSSGYAHKEEMSRGALATFLRGGARLRLFVGAPRRHVDALGIRVIRELQ